MVALSVSLHLSCSSSLDFMIPLFDSPKSDDRRKTEATDTCTYGLVLLFDMKGSDSSVCLVFFPLCQ